MIEKLESELVEQFGDFEHEIGDMAGILESTSIWAKTPWCCLAYGPRRGALGQDSPFWRDELLLGIAEMFRTLYEQCSHEVDEAACAVVDPSYDNTSLIAVVSGDRRRLLYYCSMNAWHLQWDTPDEMEHAMQKAVAEMRQNAEGAKK